MSFTIHKGIEDVEGETMSILTESVNEITEFVNDYHNEAQEEAREEIIWEARRHLEGFADTRIYPSSSASSISKSSSYFDIIMSKVKAIQKKYPKRLLCGSVALMLYGVMDKRSGGDIDFVAFENKIVPNEHLSLKCSSPHKHCLFLGAYIKEGETIDGVRLQDIDQIIFWKKSYGRKKDIKDLEKYFGNQFIKEDEFKLKE
jgi:hypothetical protein